LSVGLVGRYGVSAHGSGWCGAVRVSSGSLVSGSESSLLICGHAHALSLQSGHWFHDLLPIFVLLWGRSPARLAAAGWSFSPNCLSSCVWWCCREGFLVSECIGLGPLSSSSTGKVGEVGESWWAWRCVAVCSNVGRGWSACVRVSPSRVWWVSRVGVLLRHLMHTVAPACVVARTLSLLQRPHAPNGARSVSDMTTRMSHALICCIGRVDAIADSAGHPRVMAIRRAMTKIPQEVLSVCWVDSHTALDLGGVVVGDRGGSARRASVSWASLSGVRGCREGAGSGVSLSSHVACFHAHIVSAALWCLGVVVNDCRESSSSTAFSCRRRVPRYQWRLGMLIGKQTTEAVVGLFSSGIPLRVCRNAVQSLSARNFP
jgi:hypothetical protein